MMNTLESLRSLYEKNGQSHVFQYYDSLTSAEQSTLLEQLSKIDPNRVNSIYKTAIQADSLASSSTSSSTQLSPPPSDRVGTVINNPFQASTWNSIGLEAIQSGQVGILLMAGGQGTRLGSLAPKGCYDINLPSHKSLFQLQAERIQRLQIIAETEKEIPWYIMTSGPTREPTEQFFEENHYFGLKKSQVIFFEQGVLPCLSNEGKFLLDTKSSVAVAPDGNGGLYAALRSPLSSSSDSTVLTDLKSRGCIYVHAYCVDNCLVRVCDPTFIGYCISSKADCGAKVVTKLNPTESVGVVALRNSKWSVVEYSEIPPELSSSRDEKTGELTYRAANIANHFYTVDFLESVSKFEHEMAFHIARKKIPSIDLKTGERITPLKPNGMKLELFIFDVFPFTTSFGLLEVSRSTDFSPLKNAPGTGSDDPFTSRRDLLAEQKRWLVEAGATIEDGVEVELSALVSYSGEGLEVVKGKTIIKRGIVEKLEDFEKLF